MAEDNETQTGEETPAIKAAREAASRALEEKKGAVTRAEAAERELGEMKAAARANTVKVALGKLGAPEGIADFYPADAEVTDDAIGKFVSERIGLPKEALDAWGRYAQLQGGTHPVGPAKDRATELRDQGNKDAAWNFSVSRTPFQPSPSEQTALDPWAAEVKQLHREYELQVQAGTAEPLVDIGRGYGGLYDAPAYARKSELTGIRQN